MQPTQLDPRVFLERMSFVLDSVQINFVNVLLAFADQEATDKPARSVDLASCVCNDIVIFRGPKLSSLPLCSIVTKGLLLL